MTPTDLTAVILAAGEGKRMKSALPKVLHPLLGHPMLGHVLDAVAAVTTTPPVVVVGHGAAEVRAWLGDRARTALQERPMGTGHAVISALPALEGFSGTVLVACGDTPLVTGELFGQVISHHRSGNYSATILTALLDNPGAYGRIIRAANGDVERIVEFKDASSGERAVREINSGIYCFEAAPLRSALSRLSNANAQGEYYLTDVIGLMRGDGLRVGAAIAERHEETAGVNAREELAAAEALLVDRINRHHMRNGVTIESPATVRIGPHVTIGRDTVVRAGVTLEGRASIGERCVIGSGIRIIGAAIADGTTVVSGEIRGG